MQIGELFQKIAIGSFALLNTALDTRELTVAYLDTRLGMIALLKKWFLLRFKLRNRLGEVPRNLLPFIFDPFNSFFDSRDSQRDFFLFLLQLFKRDNLGAEFGKICSLRRSLPPQIDFTFLEKTSVVPERYPRSLALEL
jgi:hypothetical protein